VRGVVSRRREPVVGRLAEGWPDVEVVRLEDLRDVVDLDLAPRSDLLLEIRRGPRKPLRELGGRGRKG